MTSRKHKLRAGAMAAVASPWAGRVTDAVCRDLHGPWLWDYASDLVDTHNAQNSPSKWREEEQQQQCSLDRFNGL